MKNSIIPCALLLAATVSAQNFQITSFGSNGRLTWTNSFPNGAYTVEWANGLGENQVWQQDWWSLQNLAPTSATTTVQVPMFYRVRCLTNGFFWPMPTGRMLTFSISNSVGTLWTQQLQSRGTLAGPGLTNSYTYACVWDPYETNTYFMRSTDRAIYVTSDGLSEQLRWTNSRVGTSWTYYDSSGGNVATLINASATVSVPAGIFNNCLVVSNRCASCSDTTPYFIEYLKPGVGLVYWEDYWGVSDPPEVYRLQSITGL